MYSATKPLFKPGDTVYVSLLKKSCTICTDRQPRFNGFVWTYSFKDEQLSCGEGYLSRVKTEEKDKAK